MNASNIITSFVVSNLNDLCVFFWLFVFVLHIVYVFKVTCTLTNSGPHTLFVADFNGPFLDPIQSNIFNTIPNTAGHYIGVDGYFIDSNFFKIKPNETVSKTLDLVSYLRFVKEGTFGLFLEHTLLYTAAAPTGRVKVRDPSVKQHRIRSNTIEIEVQDSFAAVKKSFVRKNKNFAREKKFARKKNVNYHKSNKAEPHKHDQTNLVAVEEGFGLGISYKSCSEDQIHKLQEGMEAARKSVHSTLNALENNQFSDIFKKWFKTVKFKQEITENFKHINTLMQSTSFKFQCNPTCGSYARIFKGRGNKREVEFCSPYWNDHTTELMKEVLVMIF